MEEDKDLKEKEEEGRPFFPNHLLLEVMVAYLAIGVVLTLAILFPFGLHSKADPFSTPEAIKPEWYFLSMYQFLKYFPQKVFFVTGKVLGIIISGLGMAVLLLLPFLDRNPERHPKRRPVMMCLCAAAVLGVIIFSILGQISETERTISGKKVKFDILGIPHVVKEEGK
jgi:quinol-cytochrome oxidoreductase complex cytochrome b subunit